MRSAPHFDLETQLRDPVVAWLLDANPGAIVADEVGPRYAPADLIAGMPERLGDRLRSTIPPIMSRPELELIDFLAVPRSREDLRSLAPRSWRRFEAERLQPLVEAGILRIDDLGRWQCRRPPIPAFSPLISIELKLRDWKGALRQAAQHRLFVDAAYVALPKERIHQELLSEGARLGVGVLSVRSRNDVDCLTETPLRPPVDPVEARTVAETLLAEHLGTRGPTARAGSPRPRSAAALAPVSA